MRDAAHSALAAYLARNFTGMLLFVSLVLERRKRDEHRNPFDFRQAPRVCKVPLERLKNIPVWCRRMVPMMPGRWSADSKALTTSRQAPTKVNKRHPEACEAAAAAVRMCTAGKWMSGAAVEVKAMGSI